VEPNAGEIKTIPWEEVRAKLYARLNEQRMSKTLTGEWAGLKEIDDGIWSS